MDFFGGPISTCAGDSFLQCQRDKWIFCHKRLKNPQEEKWKSHGNEMDVTGSHMGFCEWRRFRRCFQSDLLIQYQEHRWIAHGSQVDFFDSFS